jgi:hypothetical protein
MRPPRSLGIRANKTEAAGPSPLPPIQTKSLAWKLLQCSFCGHS